MNAQVGLGLLVRYWQKPVSAKDWSFCIYMYFIIPTLLKKVMGILWRHPSIHPSVSHPSVHLFIRRLSIVHPFPKALGGIQPNATSLPPHGKVVHEQFIFPWVFHQSICSSGYLLLNYWAEFSQTFHLIVRPCESNSIFPCVHPPTICQSCYLLLNHCANFNQTCYISSPHGKGVQE